MKGISPIGFAGRGMARDVDIIMGAEPTGRTPGAAVALRANERAYPARWRFGATALWRAGAMARWRY